MAEDDRDAQQFQQVILVGTYSEGGSSGLRPVRVDGYGRIMIAGPGGTLAPAEIDPTRATTISEVVVGGDQKAPDLGDFSTAHPYVVYLCNRCNWTATHIIDERGGLSDLRPPIGRTCSAERETCLREQRYAPLLTTRCDGATFSIALRVRHPSGVWGDTHKVTIRPDCGYRGELLYLEIPDPR